MANCDEANAVDVKKSIEQKETIKHCQLRKRKRIKSDVGREGRKICEWWCSKIERV